MPTGHSPLFKYLAEWNWIVAKGVYLDDLEHQVAAMQSEVQEDIQNTIRILIISLVLICSVFLCLAYLFSKGVGALFEGYKKKQATYQKELLALNARLEKQATTDSLTRLYNRAFFNARLRDEMARAERYEKPLGLILFDIDRFKAINDQYGHLAGDRILAAIAGLCRKNLRLSDIFARWGGEEFAVLLPDNTAQDALALAEKLRGLIAVHGFNEPEQMTCSFGVTAYRPGESRDDFIHRADKALYRSKHLGRNQATHMT